jgi:hypothetical protein
MDQELCSVAVCLVTSIGTVVDEDRKASLADVRGLRVTPVAQADVHEAGGKANDEGAIGASECRCLVYERFRSHGRTSLSATPGKRACYL